MLRQRSLAAGLPIRLTYHVRRCSPYQVIRSWGNSATRRLFESGKSRFRGPDTESALELLAILNAAERLDHISPLKSVGLHPLKGNRASWPHHSSRRRGMKLRTRLCVPKTLSELMTRWKRLRARTGITESIERCCGTSFLGTQCSIYSWMVGGPARHQSRSPFSSTLLLPPRLPDS
jgi:hypothetical protein